MAGRTLQIAPAENCATFARRNPIMLISALILGCGLTFAGWWYTHMTEPVYPAMTGPPVVTRGDAGTIYVRIGFVSASPFRCLRQSNTLLMRDSGGTRTYYNLASNMGGRGLPGSVFRYETLQALPADFPSGEWRLLTRLHYECEPFGLRFYEHALPEVAITIPERTP